MPVQTNDTYERSLELVVDERVAERVDGTVEVAQPVRDVVQCRRNAGTAGPFGSGLCIAVASAAAEPNQQRQDVPRRPAEWCLRAWVARVPRDVSAEIIHRRVRRYDSGGSDVAEALASATASSRGRMLQG